MTNKRKWKYTLKDIADLTGRSIHTVRDDKRLGVLKPDTLMGVYMYVLRVGMKDLK